MSESVESAGAQSLFVTTHWSVVIAARDKASPDSAQALEALCQTYWYPLYAFIRRQGRSPHDAEDLTQEFFARLLAKDYLEAASQEKGRFRTFLRVALKRFLANQWDRTNRLKRGAGHLLLSLDTSAAEMLYRDETTEAALPDRLYDRRWALTLLQWVLAGLRAEYATAGKAAEFEQLKGVLMAERGSIRYFELAPAMGLTEGAARVAAHRLRRRFRELFRAAVASTVADPPEVEDELRYLVGVLAQT